VDYFEVHTTAFPGFFTVEGVCHTGLLQWGTLKSHEASARLV